MLEGFFTQARLALPMDQAERLANGRRKRRVDAVPETFRSAVAAFAQAQVDSRTRHRKAGVRPESDSTFEERLAVLRDFALFLVDKRPLVTGWEVVAREDVEAFLGKGPEPRRKRLSVLRKYFKWARSHRVVLVDPTRDLASKSAKGFKSPVVEQDRQRELIKRWTKEGVHPHEAFVGLSALLHAASSTELRHLRVADIDMSSHAVLLGRRPFSVPLDPVTWDALQACLAHRQSLRTLNPYVIVTKITATREQPASSPYVAHILDGAGVTPKYLRWTRLARLVHMMDPKLVAEAFGLTSEATIHYLIDSVDDARLANV